jgi:hypothetical protein
MRVELLKLGEKVGQKKEINAFKKEMDNFYSLYTRFLEEKVQLDEL